MDQSEFEKLLRCYGHFYTESPDEENKAAHRVRHLGLSQSEDLRVLCTNRPVDADHDQILMLSQLFHDLDCVECRAVIGLPRHSLTKRGLMIDIVNILVNLEQMFIEAIYWKEFRSDAEPINPDPDGVLAQQWQIQADQIIQMIERCRPLMQKHENRYGWPEELTNSEVPE